MRCDAAREISVTVRCFLLPITKYRRKILPSRLAASLWSSELKLTFASHQVSHESNYSGFYMHQMSRVLFRLFVLKGFHQMET